MKVDRRQFLAGAAVGAGLGTAGGLVLGRFSKDWFEDDKSEPNFLLLIADDMRWDAMGCAGNRIIHTANLDRLAQDGILFSNNFVTTSICPTSRASILTGQYARRHGIWDFGTALSSDAWSQTYPAILRSSGYRTGFIGKWGLGGRFPGSSFDFWAGFPGHGRYFEEGRAGDEHLTNLLARQAVDFIRSQSAGSPFCLTVSFKAPHVQDGDPEPFQPAPELSSLYRDVTVPRPPTATEQHFARLPLFLQDSEGRRRWKRRFASKELFQHSVKRYYRLVTGLDRAVARILSALIGQGLNHSSYIFFTSDNGFFLGEHGLAGKWWMFEESIRTPLIIRPPAGVHAWHNVMPAITLNIDIAPTILDLARLTIPKTMQGKSLVGLMAGDVESVRHEFFYEHLFDHPKIAQSEGVRSERWKYIRYTTQGPATEMLFDLSSDPFEENNLANDPAFARDLERMRQRWWSLRSEAA